MSEDEFHVHGAHEHLAHESAHAGGHAPPRRLAQYVAIFTALLSTLGAFVSYQGANTLSEAMLHKNEAVLRKTQASDQWSFYQAKSIKGHLMEMAVDLAPPDRRAHYEQEVARYNREKAELKAKAEELEQESLAADAHSKSVMHPHHRQAQAMTLLQIAIALASVTALTRQRWLFGLAAVAAVGGIGLWLSALFL
jgi:hypothetical protein